MNINNNILSFTNPFNGNTKDQPRFKREFNAIVNANGASKLIKSRSILVSTSEYDDLDLDNNDGIKKEDYIIKLIVEYLHLYNLILLMLKI